MDGTPEMIAITVDLADFRDINDYDYSREMSWDVADVDGLTEVTLATNGTPTASEIIIDVSADCGGNSKEISGLGTETTDWVVGSGTISSVAESATVRGRYTITGSTMAGTINLAAPPDRSDDILVISSGAIDSGI